MKRQKRLLVLTGVLAACVVIAFGISRINFEEKMTGEETVIVDVDAADITGLSWNYENEEMEFSKEDDEWVYDKDGKMAVDQDLLSEIAENLSSITSDKIRRRNLYLKRRRLRISDELGAFRLYSLLPS